MSFAENLKKARECKNITQEELAEAIGVRQPAYTRYERGSAVPNAVDAVILAKLLQTTVEKLVEE